MNYMKQQNIDIQSELMNYAPECACYAPQTQAQQGYPPSTPSVCYKNGCDISSNPSVYLDPNSRDGTSQKTCSLTICNSINDFSGMTVGGGANISTQTQNQCGEASGNSGTSTPGNSGTSTPDNSGTSIPDNSGTSSSSNSGISTPSNSGISTPSNSGTSSSSNSGTSSSSNPNNNTVLIIVIVLIILLFCFSGVYFLRKKKWK